VVSLRGTELPKKSELEVDCQGANGCRRSGDAIYVIHFEN
jgi:hypothetical protein